MNLFNTKRKKDGGKIYATNAVVLAKWQRLESLANITNVKNAREVEKINKIKFVEFVKPLDLL